MRPIEVIWTSSAFTDSSSCKDPEAVLTQPDRFSSFVFALESDLFDSSVIEWGNERQNLTLEIIPGLKKENDAEDIIDAREVVHSVVSIQSAEKLPPYLEAINTSDLGSQGVGPAHDVSETGTAARPFPVRTDGIEDPVTGWKPTGVVFFETIRIPERKIVYSSILDGIDLPNSLEDTEPDQSELPDFFAYNKEGKDQSFFDYPDHFPTLPSESTDEYYVVNRGGGFFRGFFSKVFFLFTLFLLFVVLIIFGAVGTYSYYAYNRLFKDAPAVKSADFIVRPNETFISVINRMQKNDLLGSFMGIDDKYLMRLLAYSEQNAHQLKPGAYRIDVGKNLKSVYGQLIKGSTDYKITIPEGKSAAEVAIEVKKVYDTFDEVRFVELVHDPAFAKKMGVEADSLEGYLYPSTYYFGPGMKEEELIKLMVGTFKQKVEETRGGMSTDDGLTFHAHVIIASLIEREARVDSDRPLIASVIYNRLSKEMPLQIDATVNYALNDWRRLLNVDYRIDHPYNTYKFKGLPPGPIASPRIESLLATFDVPETNYLYYVHRGDGHHAFAETYEEHLANVGRYIRNKGEGSMGNAPLVETTTENNKAAE